MKIAVMGAGAVGCYYGGMLARAGHEVTLIARAHHATAINASGLLLETQAFTERVRVAASTDASAADGAQWVLFCVKSTDTESAGRALAPHLAEGAVVLSLQNGVDNAERLQATIGHPVIPAVVYVATEMAGPGHVRHHGRGELVIAPSPASAQNPHTRTRCCWRSMCTAALMRHRLPARVGGAPADAPACAAAG